jgi:hypothetical protein
MHYNHDHWFVTPKSNKWPYKVKQKNNELDKHIQVVYTAQSKQCFGSITILRVEIVLTLRVITIEHTKHANITTLHH